MQDNFIACAAAFIYSTDDFFDFVGNVAKFVRVGKHIFVLVEGVLKVAYTIFKGLDVL